MTIINYDVISTGVIVMAGLCFQLQDCGATLLQAGLQAGHGPGVEMLPGLRRGAVPSG